ncbi:MAG TPA: alanine racemase [Candidatus Brocadiales bacterium]|nr:alanine racemase [Candidatus Brocadiales bacterium]
MQRPTWVEIDLDAIAHNVRAVCKKIGEDIKILAVVKADAYGHGAIETSRVLLKNGVELLGVAIPEEGIELRQAGINASIIILGSLLPEQLDSVVAFSLTPTICDRLIAKELSYRAQKLHRKLKIHIKVDTGMRRLGVWHEDAVNFVKEIKHLNNLEIEGIYTHLATSDEEDKGFAYEQIGLFINVLKQLDDQNIHIPLKHVANSGAILDMPASYFNMVRPGLVLYGLYPSNSVSRSIRLQPAMTFKTRIAYIKDVQKGVTIGYGRTYKTSKPSRVATLPVGYVDGYSRSFSNRGEVIVNGYRAPIIGRVCMDQCIIDVSAVPDVSIGNEVVLYGKSASGGTEEIPVETAANLIGAIPYEIVSTIGKRVPKVYVSKSSNLEELALSLRAKRSNPMCESASKIIV